MWLLDAPDAEQAAGYRPYVGAAERASLQQHPLQDVTLANAKYCHAAVRRSAWDSFGWSLLSTTEPTCAQHEIHLHVRESVFLKLRSKQLEQLEQGWAVQVLLTDGRRAGQLAQPPGEGRGRRRAGGGARGAGLAGDH